MLVLGIESTAHTFGVGLINFEKRKVLFNEKITFSDKENGMDLRKISDFHTANFDSVLVKLKKYLSKNNLTLYDINLISFSRGPGIGNSLRVGALVAKTLSLKYDIKIIGVNHIISHLEVGKWYTKLEDPIFLNITGVNSQVISQDKISKIYKVYGETLDIGLGNLFDTIGRVLGLGFPAGPKIEELAKKSKNFIKIPYSIKGMNVSFAGINSFVKNEFIKIKNKHKDNKKLIEQFKYDISYSLQETCFPMILEICERALAYTKKKEVVIVGGVASNLRFVDMTKQLAKSRNIKYKALDLKLCMDNGVMIAVCGGVYSNKSKNNIKGLKPLPYVRCENGGVL